VSRDARPGSERTAPVMLVIYLVILVWALLSWIR
jgi:hypothetical protein